MTTAKKGRVLVVGAGISGLTAATALGKRGWEVLVIERKPEVADHGGVGLTMVGNAMRALDEIGVAESCVAAGVPMDSVVICRPDGTPLATDPMQPLGGERWPAGTGMKRSSVHSILSHAAAAVSTIRCSTTVLEWHAREDGVDVVFNDGSKEAFDLVVAAEGIYSQTRARLLPDIVPQPTGQAVWRAEVPRPRGMHTTHLYVGGRQGMVGICPISKDDAYLYIVQAGEDARRDADTLDVQMREELEGYGGLVADLAPLLNDPRKVSYRPLEWLLAPKPWGVGRIILIGDAAHSNPPILAQGAAMGVEDGVVLAEELDGAVGFIDDALVRFINRRYPRASEIVRASCELTRAQVDRASDIDVLGEIQRSHALLCEPA